MRFSISTFISGKVKGEGPQRGGSLQNFTSHIEHRG